MKKLFTVLLFITLVTLLSACDRNDKGIDYHKSVRVPSVIEVDIDSIPSTFEPFITVDYDYVLKVSFNTDDVMWDVEGDHPIKVIVDYTDGTSLIFNSILRLTRVENIGKPQIIGVRNRLISKGTEELDLLEGVAFTDDTKIVDSGVLGSIDYGTNGVYTIVYYAEDEDGNFISASSVVIIGDNLPYYENLLDTFVELNSSEKAVVREYALLYTAAIEKNKEENGKEIMDFFGYFINTSLYEELLHRNLRNDEINCINQMKTIFKKNDRNRYEEFFNVTLSANEKEHFDVVYEILSSYASTLNPFTINPLSTLANTSNIELYLAGSTDLNTDDVTSLAFYRVFSNLSLDPIYFEVINATSYEFDYRLLEVTDTNVFDTVKDLVTQTNPAFLDRIPLQNPHLTEEELAFLDIYGEYYQYKVLYEIKTYLVNNGYVVDMTDLEESYLLLLEAYKQANEEDFILANIIEIEDVSLLLDKSFNSSEEVTFLHLVEGFNQFYPAPYSEVFENFGKYLSEEEKAQIYYVYKEMHKLGLTEEDLLNETSFITYNMDIENFSSMYQAFLDVRYYIKPFYNEEDIYLMRTFDFEKQEIDELVRYYLHYYEEYYYYQDRVIEYGVFGFTPGSPFYKMGLYRDLVTRYDGAIDSEGINQINQLVDVIQEHRIEANVYYMLSSLNDFDVFQNKYSIAFTAQEKEAIASYITWSTAYVSQYLGDQTNFLELRICQPECEDAFDTVKDFLYPSTYLINYEFMNMSERSLEVLLGKDAPENYEEAVQTIVDGQEQFLVIKDYFERRLSYTQRGFYSAHSFDFVLDERYINYLDEFQSLHEKRFNLPYKVDLLFNIKEEDIMDYVTTDEYELLERLYMEKVVRHNKLASNAIVNYLYEYNRIDLMFDLVMVIDIIKENYNVITVVESVNPENYSDSLAPREIEAFNNIYAFLQKVNYIEDYIETMNIPIGVTYDVDRMVNGVRALFKSGYSPKTNIYTLNDLLFKNKTNNGYVMSEEEYLDVQYYLTYKFHYIYGDVVTETYGDLLEAVPSFEQGVYDLSYRLISNDQIFTKEIPLLNAFLIEPLTKEEEYIYSLIRAENVSAANTPVYYTSFVLLKEMGLLEDITFDSLEELDMYTSSYISENLHDMVFGSTQEQVELLASVLDEYKEDPEFITNHLYPMMMTFKEMATDVFSRINTDATDEEFEYLHQLVYILFDLDPANTNIDPILYSSYFDNDFLIQYRYPGELWLQNYNIDGQYIFDQNPDLYQYVTTLLLYPFIRAELEQTLYIMNTIPVYYSDDIMPHVNLNNSIDYSKMVDMKVDTVPLIKLAWVSVYHHSLSVHTIENYFVQDTIFFNVVYDKYTAIQNVEYFANIYALNQNEIDMVIYNEANQILAEIYLNQQILVTGFPIEESAPLYELTDLIIRSNKDNHYIDLHDFLYDYWLAEEYSVTDEEMSLLNSLYNVQEIKID